MDWQLSVLGPAITAVSHTPNVPNDAQDIVVTARVSPSSGPVAARCGGAAPPARR